MPYPEHTVDAVMLAVVKELGIDVTLVFGL